MAPPGTRLVRRIARRLAAALELRVGYLAENRIGEILSIGARSPRHFEATFAAVQTLRDVGLIEPSEAAYLFHFLLDLCEPGSDEPADERLVKLVDELQDHTELLDAAISRQLTEGLERFYRSRGEYELADLVAGDMDAYFARVTEGELWIVARKRHLEDAPADERGADSRLVLERVLALSSQESLKEWIEGWRGVIDSLRDVTPETAVRAVQEAHSLGATSFDQHLRLMDVAVEELVWEECHVDRRFTRLEQKREVLTEALHIDLTAPDEKQPFEYRMVEAGILRLHYGLMAVVLRRYGEHRLANLLIEDPAEYERIRGEI